jgi:hypothetical protein
MANFTIFAQNSSVNYIKQAYLCALSIRATNPNSKICLITNDAIDDTTKSVFDDIVEIPWDDQSANSEWKIENRWKIYHACPYERTFVLDSDMLVLDNIEHWWNSLEEKDLFFTSHVLSYRNTLITDSYYRKSFVQHELPNLYCGVFYFKKSVQAHEFFKWLELVMNNWELFYGQFAGGNYFQKFPSLDVSAAIVTKILGYKDAVTSDTLTFPNFVHMKPHIQDWWTVKKDRWQDRVGVYLDNSLNLKIGNFKQSGIFHYTEKDFITEDIIKIYERYLDLTNE